MHHSSHQLQVCQQVDMSEMRVYVLAGLPSHWQHRPCLCLADRRDGVGERGSSSPMGDGLECARCWATPPVRAETCLHTPHTPVLAIDIHIYEADM